jgi:two-component system chemotaxis response regulator CheY
VRVNYLVVESSQTVREALCYVLLSFGIKGIPAQNRARAEEILASGDHLDGAVVDIDNTDTDGIALVHALRASERWRGVPVIVHTVQSTRDLVLRMVEMGVTGYLLKPFSADTARAKLAAIFSRLSTHNIQRKHIRVKPDPSDLARVSFRLSRSPQLYSGRIGDISLGGVAIELFTPPAEDHFPADTPLVGMSFSLSGRALSPSGIVVQYKSPVLAVRFGVLEPADTKALERYIFKSISS